jgi:hypothetical protein
MSGRMAAKRLLTVADRVLQVSSGQRAAIHLIHIVNSSSSMRRVRVHHVVNNEGATTENALLYDVAASPRSTIIHDGRFMMTEGDELIALADGSGVSITVHGLLAE